LFAPLGCEILAVMNRSALQGLFKAQLSVFTIALLNRPSRRRNPKNPQKLKRDEKSMRKIAVLASALGIFAGLGGGVLHGIGEILQGNAVPNGIMIEAWPALRPSLQNLSHQTIRK
jgi:uncharacterized membrane protein YfcA